MLRRSVASKRLRSFAVRATRAPGWPLASIRLARPRPAADIMDRACLRDISRRARESARQHGRFGGADVVSCGITGTTSPASSGSRSGPLSRSASNRRVTPIRDAREWRKALVSASWTTRQTIRLDRTPSAPTRGSASSTRVRPRLHFRALRERREAPTPEAAPLISVVHHRTHDLPARPVEGHEL